MIEQEIDNIFGELGYLPNIPVDGSGFYIPCNVYAVIIKEGHRGGVYINGWINVHTIKAKEKQMVHVSSVEIPKNARLSELEMFLGIGELPYEWYEKVCGR